jgi:hypothetical protein
MNSRSIPLCFLAIPFLSAQGGVEGFVVTTDRTVDSSSLETIVRDVLRISGARTNDEKAIALYEYLHQAIFHRACPVEGKPQTVGPLKMLNVYGWSLCGSQHTALKALYETAGWKCRYLGWPGHSTIEVFYDGRWHYLDVFLKCYFWSKDKTHITSQEEIAADPSIVLDAVKEGRAAPQHLCCGDSPEDVVKGCKARVDYGDSKGWGELTWRDEGYSAQITLPVGARLRLDWSGTADGFVVSIPHGPPVHTCGIKEFVNDRKLGPLFEHYGPRSWSNGRFEYSPRFDRPAEIRDVAIQNAKTEDGRLTATNGKGTTIFKILLPYPFVNADIRATFDGGDGSLSISLNEGRTWSPINEGDVTRLVRQKYKVWIKAEFPSALTQFQFTATVEHNRGVLPYLVNGKNRVTVSPPESLPKNVVGEVTYSYQEAQAPTTKGDREYNGRGVVYGPIKTVARQFSQTPFSFDFDVGGDTSPKMISIERSLRAR